MHRLVYEIFHLHRKVGVLFLFMQFGICHEHPFSVFTQYFCPPLDSQEEVYWKHIL